MANSGSGKIFKWIVGIAAVLLILGGGWFHLRLAKFEDMTRELKEDGCPVSMAELRHKPEKDKSDALPLIVEAIPLLKKFSEDLHELEKKHLDTDEFLSFMPSYFSVSSEAKLADLKELLDRNEELAKQVERIFESKDITVKVTPVLNGNVKSSEDDLGSLAAFNFLPLAKFVRVRLHVLSNSGDGKTVIADGLEAIKFGKMVAHRNDGWFTNNSAIHVATCAIQSIYEAMSANDLPDSSFVIVNQALEGFELQKTFVRAISADRATAIEHLADGGIQHMAINGAPMLEFYEIKEDQAHKELFEFECEPRKYTLWKDCPWLVNMGDSFDLIYSWHRSETVAIFRGSRIVSALRQHNITPEEFEAFEDVQAELVKLGVPESMTRDTCTGEVMKIKFSDGRWQVWSVGTDKVDDGGVPGKDEVLAWRNEQEQNGN